jgi:hypothetical protein
LRVKKVLDFRFEEECGGVRVLARENTNDDISLFNLALELCHELGGRLRAAIRNLPEPLPELGDYEEALASRDCVAFCLYTFLAQLKDLKDEDGWTLCSL